jgi:hypothetical protein
MVFDNLQRRMTHFDSGGKVIRTFEDTPEAICCLRDGSFLHEPDAPPGISLIDPDPRDTTSQLAGFALVRLSEPAVSRAVFLSLARTQSRIRVVQPGYRGVNVYPRPYYRLTSVALAGDEIVYGTGSDFSFVVYSREGKELRTIRIPFLAKRVSPSSLAAQRELFISDGGDQVMQAKHREIFDAIPHHDTEPAYRGILAEEDGTVWVRRFESDHRGSRWFVRFDKRGAMLGTLEIPEGLALERFTRGHVLLRRDDDSTGLTSLHVYRVVKS